MKQGCLSFVLVKYHTRASLNPLSYLTMWKGYCTIELAIKYNTSHIPHIHLDRLEVLHLGINNKLDSILYYRTMKITPILPHYWNISA